MSTVLRLRSCCVAGALHRTHDPARCATRVKWYLHLDTRHCTRNIIRSRRTFFETNSEFVTFFSFWVKDRCTKTQLLALHESTVWNWLLTMCVCRYEREKKENELERKNSLTENHSRRLHSVLFLRTASSDQMFHLWKRAVGRENSWKRLNLGLSGTASRLKSQESAWFT